MPAYACTRSSLDFTSDEVMSSKAGREAAKAICKTCNTRQECLVLALKDGISFGMWGGMTPAERKAIPRSTVAILVSGNALLDTLSTRQAPEIHTSTYTEGTHKPAPILSLGMLFAPRSVEAEAAPSLSDLVA